MAGCNEVDLSISWWKPGTKESVDMAITVFGEVETRLDPSGGGGGVPILYYNNIMLCITMIGSSLALKNYGKK